MGNETNDAIGLPSDSERVLPCVGDGAAEVSGEVTSAVACEDISGLAGTGKTTYVRQRIDEDPSWGMLTAVTGIAAMNLGTTTINSCLGYFDTASLQESYDHSRLQKRLFDLRADYRRLVIDERSMMEAAQLDLIYLATTAANMWPSEHPPLGLTLVGDWAQLSPVHGRWAFEADCWAEFATHTLKLTKIWRQDEPEFLAALNYTRYGDGAAAAEILSQQGVEWASQRDVDFAGTTIMPTNAAVRAHNDSVMLKLQGCKITLAARRWGKQATEWGFNTRTKEWGIPPSQELKIGTYVVIRSNKRNAEGLNFSYVNGDCGTIEDWQHGELVIRLVRGPVVSVGKIVRSMEVAKRPEGNVPPGEGYSPWAHRNSKKRYVVGQIEYYPVIPAWATTVHRSQGLSLDAVQFDFRDRFASHPGICYVALSRCRTLGGLRLVGQRDYFVRQCQCDPRIKEWL
jgi:ATP-dependent DNA helicase PIF1